MPYGSGGISHTYNKARHYFLCESKDNMVIIENLRNKNIVKQAKFKMKGGFDHRNSEILRYEYCPYPKG